MSRYRDPEQLADEVHEILELGEALLTKRRRGSRYGDSKIGETFYKGGRDDDRNGGDDDGDGDEPTAHAQRKAKHHEKMAELYEQIADAHASMSDHYGSGAKGAHAAKDDARKADDDNDVGALRKAAQRTGEEAREARTRLYGVGKAAVGAALRRPQWGIP